MWKNAPDVPRIDWPRSIAPKGQRLLVAWGEAVDYAPGQWLKLEADLHGALIVSGTVGAYARVNAESDVLGAIIGPGTLIATMEGPYASQGMRLIARTAVRLLAFRDSTAKRLGLDILPSLLEMQRLKARQLALLIERAAQRSAMPMPARLAAELLFIECQYQSPELAVTQDELAELCGVTRKTINYHLRAMRASGILTVSYRSVRIVDEAAMRTLIDTNALPIPGTGAKMAH